MARPDPAAKHIDAAKRRLAHLGGISARTDEAERRILEAAEDRMQAVDSDLAKLRPRVITDRDAADRYQALTLERGQLALVAARSRELLGDSEPMAKALEDGEPRTLYVMRPVKNGDAIIAWAREAGIPNLMPAGDLHVTIAFSRKPVDWNTVEPRRTDLLCTAHESEVKPLGDEGAVVLRFTAPNLERRWQEFRDAGCSWDYPGYQPHVTLTYHADGADLSKVKPYDGPIELGPERFDEVDEDKVKAVRERP